MRAFAEGNGHGVTRLVVAEPIAVDPAAVVSVLSDPFGWLGVRDERTAAPPGMRRVAADLRLRVGDHVGLTTFRKAAYVDVGQPVRTADGWRIEIGWRAATLAPLFPVFSGELVVGDDRIELNGLYAPPGGMIGRMADRAMLNLAARGTGRWFLRQLALAAELAAR